MPDDLFLSNHLQGGYGLAVVGMIGYRGCHENSRVKIGLHTPEVSLMRSSRMSSTAVSQSKPRGTFPKWTQMPFFRTMEGRCSTGLKFKPYERSSSSRSDPSLTVTRSR